MALTKFSTLLSSQRTNTHHHEPRYRGPLRATSSEYTPRCMMSTRGDRTPPRPSRRRPRGAPTPTRHGRCPPRLGCRSALPRLRTKLSGCQLPWPTLAHRCVRFPRPAGCGSDARAAHRASSSASNSWSPPAIGMILVRLTVPVISVTAPRRTPKACANSEGLRSGRQCGLRRLALHRPRRHPYDECIVVSAAHPGLQAPGRTRMVTLTPTVWRRCCLPQQHRKLPHANAKGPPGCGWGPLWWGCVRRCPTLPHPGGCSTIGAGGLSFRVRDGSGRFPSAMAAVTCVELFGCGVPVLRELHSGCVWFVVSPRPISTGQLHTLRCFHFRPINPVVWLGALTHEGWETSSWNELPA